MAIRGLEIIKLPCKSKAHLSINGKGKIYHSAFTMNHSRGNKKWFHFSFPLDFDDNVVSEAAYPGCHCSVREQSVIASHQWGETMWNM